MRVEKTFALSPLESPVTSPAKSSSLGYLMEVLTYVMKQDGDEFP